MSHRPTETAFTQRLRQTLTHCLRLKPPYNPADFRKAIDACGGDFAPRAQQMLREQLHQGLVTLANRRALHLSMEWIILNEPEWEPLFTDEDRTLARQRLETAGKLTGS
ncbi:MAG: hypothetical protein ACF8R9_13500 [Phycisphaerales bacterium JB054]